MKHIASLTFALALTTIGAQSWATSHDKHDGYHPAGAASAPAAKTPPGKAVPAMARPDAQLKAMREMHEKMVVAKTPEERSALMAEHMKTMQNGMAMMKGMSPDGMAGIKGSSAERSQMMEKRMQMMEAMMQMMMDRLPAAPIR